MSKKTPRRDHGRAGPPVRTDLADLYIFRDAAGGIELLQLRRVGGRAHGTWHPVMGGIERGETAPAAMLREAREETGLTPADIEGFWSLGTAFPAYLPPSNAAGLHECVLLAPRLALRVRAGWEPTLNDEHDAHRWVPRREAIDGERCFYWPTQRAAVRELLELVSDGPASACEPTSRLDWRAHF